MSCFGQLFSALTEIPDNINLDKKTFIWFHGFRDGQWPVSSIALGLRGGKISMAGWCGGGRTKLMAARNQRQTRYSEGQDIVKDLCPTATLTCYTYHAVLNQMD